MPEAPRSADPRPRRLYRAAAGLASPPPSTYLEMTAPPPPRPAPERPDLQLRPPRRPDRDPAALADYRTISTVAIGRDLLWFSRAGLSDASLASPPQHATASRSGSPAGTTASAVGLVELDSRDATDRPGDTVEIVYFGLAPDAIGGGAGRWLMERTPSIRAFARGRSAGSGCTPATSTTPTALDFYRRSGFRPYKFGDRTGARSAPDRPPAARRRAAGAPHRTGQLSPITRAGQPPADLRPPCVVRSRSGTVPQIHIARDYFFTSPRSRVRDRLTRSGL